MSLRAFLYNFSVLVISFISNKTFAKTNPTNFQNGVPYEIKFADVTFQLNEVTRYLVQNEYKAILSNREAFQGQIDRFSTFLPAVEPLLKNENVPNDFKYLMLYDKYQSSIENNTKIENGVFWCLNKEMATDVDLVMNQQIDERKHLFASTKGAALCFKRNQILYKNWGTTLFAHIADKKVLNLLDVVKKWSSNQYILLESPSYSAIIQFLAYKLAIENGFPLYKPNTQKIVYEYPYSKGKSINKVASELKVEMSTIAEYNPWLYSKTVPDSECKFLIVVPSERYNEIRVLAELTQKIGMPAQDLGFPILKKNAKFSKNKGGIFYEANGLPAVQAEMCDNFVTMAWKADLSFKKFLENNNLKETDLIHIGQIYYLDKKRSKAEVPFHVTREGETLWDISQTYGVKLENLLEFNRLDVVQRLQRGRIIWMQKTRPKNKPIEYVELPNEFQEIEEVYENESELILVEKPKEENDAKNSSKKDFNEEFDINSLPLTKEIRKDSIKNLNLQGDNLNRPAEIKEVNKVIKENKSAKNNEKIQPSQKDIQIKSTINNSKISNKYLFHSVKSNETIFGISVDYQVAVEDLRSMNNLKSDKLVVGMVLKIKKM